MRNIRLTLAYDGTGYVGWQVQKNGSSVQAALERAIENLTGEKVSLLAAGRTDSGVHALGQTANFQTETAIPCEKIQSGLQRFLPDDIVVRRVVEVPGSFHATYDAKSKRYRYVIHNSRTIDPFLRRYALRFTRPLDDGRMHEAAQWLVGTHDFRSFETQFPNKATSVRTVIEARVWRCGPWAAWSDAEQEPGGRGQESAVRGHGSGVGNRGSRIEDRDPLSLIPHPSSQNTMDHGQRTTDDGQCQSSIVNHQSSARTSLTTHHSPLANPIVCFDIVADGFLYNMVRAIVGTLVNVGTGKWNVEDVRTILEAQDRDRAGDTAPPHGLYLVAVNY